MKIIGSDPVVIVHQTEPDGIDLAPPLTDELFGSLEIVIGTNAHDFEIVAEEFGSEVTVETAGPQADTGDVFHRCFFPVAVFVAFEPPA